MASIASVLMISTFALSSANAPTSPAARPATLTFDTRGNVLAGISYGIDAVDSRATFLGDRRETRVAAGLRTVSYSCPADDGSTRGGHITFNFDEGSAYRLSCRHGEAEVIRADSC